MAVLPPSLSLWVTVATMTRFPGPDENRAATVPIMAAGPSRIEMAPQRRNLSKGTAARTAILPRQKSTQTSAASTVPQQQITETPTASTVPHPQSTEIPTLPYVLQHHGRFYFSQETLKMHTCHRAGGRVCFKLNGSQQRFACSRCELGDDSRRGMDEDDYSWVPCGYTINGELRCGFTEPDEATGNVRCVGSILSSLSQQTCHREEN